MQPFEKAKRWFNHRKTKFQSNLSVRSKSLNLKEISHMTALNSSEKTPVHVFKRGFYRDDWKIFPDLQNSSAEDPKSLLSNLQKKESFISNEEKEQKVPNDSKNSEILSNKKMFKEENKNLLQKTSEDLNSDSEFFSLMYHAMLAVFFLLRFYYRIFLLGLSMIFPKCILQKGYFLYIFSKIMNFFGTAILIFYFLFCSFFFGKKNSIRRKKMVVSLKKYCLKQIQHESMRVFNSKSEKGESDIFVEFIFKRTIKKANKNNSQFLAHKNKASSVFNFFNFENIKNSLPKSNSNFSINKNRLFLNKKFEFDEKFKLERD